MKTILVALAVGLMTIAQAADIHSVRKVFIEKMDNNLDEYLRAEFTKQFKGQVSVVLSAADADAILAGVSEEQKGTGAKLRAGTLGFMMWRQAQSAY